MPWGDQDWNEDERKHTGSRWGVVVYAVLVCGGLALGLAGLLKC